MNPATVACSALLALSVLACAHESRAQTQTAPASPQARPAPATPAAPRQANPGQSNPGQPNPGQTNPAQANPGQATAPQPTPGPRQASPGQTAPAQAAPASGGRGAGAGAGRRPRSSYASCNRLAQARGLRGGARRRFLIRCKLGYERPRQPQTAPARQP